MSFSAIAKAAIELLGKIIPLVLGRRKASDDPDILRFVTTCFTRPAFLTPFSKEASDEDFIQAIEDTITALNTGKLKDRKDRSFLAESKPVHVLFNPAWRRTLVQVVARLRDIHTLYRKSEQAGKFRSSLYEGRYHWPEKDLEVAKEIDQIRQSILTNLNIVLRQAGLPPIP